MTTIHAEGLHFQQLNDRIRAATDTHIAVDHCLGQRYIASGMQGLRIDIHGTPGNALGAYLDGCDITVFGNAQDATGDTMNAGTIAIHGRAGDATGYAMRGGTILVEGDTGYRAGIHMKAYREKVPALVIGGEAGSFLGEYQAGGWIIVLGLNRGHDGPPVGNFCGTGMHGGHIAIRGERLPPDLPDQITAAPATREQMAAIRPYLQQFCSRFRIKMADLLAEPFQILSPNTKNPYKQLYTAN